MKNNQPKTSTCRCPYCDAPIKVEPPFCQPCNVELRFCRQCGHAIPKNAERCPECGQVQAEK